VEIYNSEEEQLEAIKKWWKENGRAVVTGVVLGVALILGWNFWQERQLRISQQASALFQQALLAMNEKKSETALQLSERLVKEYGDGAYGLYGRLLLAKLKSERADMPGAKQALEGVFSSKADTDVSYQHIARLRLVELLLSNGEFDAARQRLEEAEKTGGFGTYQSQYEELRGDALAALGSRDEARDAYRRAKNASAFSALLDMKIDDLGVPEAMEK
jgi:predicted negative regulator of RcsB-dependent stress response